MQQLASQIEAPSYPLTIDHVTKEYGGTAVVEDLSFEVQPGRVTGFLGPNGAGKSTTMKILLGLASATAGSATIGGIAYRDLPNPSGIVGTSIEANAFHPGRSGRNHLRILADATDTPVERVDEVLELVELSQAANRHAGAYSLGMKQRLGLAAALLCDPPVLVLDEPGNGLDPQGIRTLRNLLRARAADGHTVFVSSHLLGEVEQLADDVVVVNKGRLVTKGSLAEMRQSASLVRTSSSDVLRAELERAGGVVETPQPDTLVVRGLSLDQIG
ncbi:MAG: ATP-binding cassette domain-containing protein, partial [Acidimicrobiia bacterium]|nr:ATP-binding cassette domain-containing protein [Acidimicrobiia bacterium]